jgi:hypothetical protein
MVEYLRLVKGDSFQSIARNWHRPEALILLGVVGVIIVVGYFVTRK